VSDPRAAAAEALLRARGLAGATVRADGPEGEIAAIRLPESGPGALLGADGAAAAAEIRALGFRYVAVDLD
jgi:hypothetical protein